LRPLYTALLSRADQERLQIEVVLRVLESFGAAPREIERALFDTLYHERQRLETESDRAAAQEQARFYDRVHSEALHANAARQRALLKEVVQGFAEEISGHFDPRVYAVATRIIPRGLNLLLNALSPLKLLRAATDGFASLEERVRLEGETDALRQAVRRGTVVLLPTHLSNLDSILMGYAIFRLGLPPFLYGAGLNLFTNPVIGFFMHNLGAYRVDRRKKAPLYKDVLKTYAGCSIELGYHNLFFPGGTRSRSGAVERRLKLGLLGTALAAYIRNLQRGRTAPDVFVVPCTINYQLVLEAETLIGDWLKAEGRSRYIIEDDEFSRPALVLHFVRKLVSLDSSIHVVFGRPMDVFGNVVDDELRSVDRRGRVIDRRRYVQRDDAFVFDEQRDQEYTRGLASAVVGAFRRDTVVFATHVVARAVFEWLRERAPELDLYRLLLTGGREESLPLAEAHGRVAALLQKLRAEGGRGALRLSSIVASGDAARVIDAALAHFASYHRRPALERRGDRLFHEDRNLLLYYQNRLGGEERQRRLDAAAV